MVVSISADISITIFASSLLNASSFAARITCLAILASAILFGARNVFMTIAAGATSLAAVSPGFAFGFFEGAAGGGSGSGVLDGFTGGCLLVILVLFSCGAFDSPPNKVSKSTGFAEVLLARGRTGAGGGCRITIMRGAFGALLDRGRTAGGGGGGRVGGVGVGATSGFLVALLDRAFSGGSTGGSLLLVLTLGTGGFNASLLLDRVFAGPSGIWIT